MFYANDFPAGYSEQGLFTVTCANVETTADMTSRYLLHSSLFTPATYNKGDGSMYGPIARYEFTPKSFTKTRRQRKVVQPDHGQEKQFVLFFYAKYIYPISCRTHCD